MKRFSKSSLLQAAMRALEETAFSHWPSFFTQNTEQPSYTQVLCIRKLILVCMVTAAGMVIGKEARYQQIRIGLFADVIMAYGSCAI